MIEVELSDLEQHAAAEAATRINRHKDEIGKPNRKWKENEDYFGIRYDSLLAETAVAKCLGLPQPTWPTYDGGDGRIDLVLPKYMLFGQTIQVKHRRERGRDLATEGLDFHRELKADIYVLTWPGTRDDSITVVGWISKPMLISHIMNNPPVKLIGMKYVIPFENLNRMEVLLEQINA